MSTNYNKLLNNLSDLKLEKLKDNLPQYIDMINNGDKSLVDGLYELTEKEKAFKKQKAIKACVMTAGFPFLKTIEDYDFSFQPGLNKKEIEDYLTLRFIDNNENILFIGSSGVGKSHLSTSIGIEAAKHRYSVHFVTCQNLIEDLQKSEKENRLDKRLKLMNRYKLLIIDEIGYINFSTESANLFFQLISQRYEKKSTIITTNRNLSKWNEVFGDPIITNAILDRLLHHCHIVNIVGPSYRTKDLMDVLDDSMHSGSGKY